MEEAAWSDGQSHQDLREEEEEEKEGGQIIKKQVGEESRIENAEEEQ